MEVVESDITNILKYDKRVESKLGEVLAEDDGLNDFITYDVAVNHPCISNYLWFLVLIEYRGELYVVSDFTIDN